MFFRGSHPMAHANSVKHSNTSLSNKTKLSPVRQKEGSLIIDWLSEKIKSCNSDIQLYKVVAKPANESTAEQKCSLLDKQATSYDQINNLLNAREKPSKTIQKNKYLLKKWNILHKLIIPHLNARLNSLENLLVPQSSQNTEDKKSNFDSRKISGWTLKDVDDEGNCFYDAVIHQMQLIHHPFLEEIPDGTLPRNSLRSHIQQGEFRDGEWADLPEIIELARSFNVIVSIVRTENPENGFEYYYTNDLGDIIPTYQEDLLPNRPIIRLAYTGNHYLSVVETADELIGRALRSSSPSISFFEKMRQDSLKTADDYKKQQEHDKEWGLIIKK